MKTRSRITLPLALIVLACTATLLSARDSVDRGIFTEQDKAFYLNDHEFVFLKPGLELEILGVEIPADRQTEVRFTLADPDGRPLDREGHKTPGEISTNFILAYIPAGEKQYVNYITREVTSSISGNTAIQGTSDSSGTYTELAPGEYLYKFVTVLPEDFDMDVTHTLGIYARRDLRDYELDRYVDNALYHFVPSGASDPQPRQVVTTETCNGRCHNPLALHGGSRQDTGLCILCHQPTQGTDPDTGNTVDFKQMVHKIHMGGDLTKPYIIIGFGNSVHDWSGVEFPDQINRCETCHTGGTPTEEFPLVADPPRIQSCNRKGKGPVTFTWDSSPVRAALRRNAPDGPTLARGREGELTTGSWIQDGDEFYLVDTGSGNTLQKMTLHTTVLGCEDPEAIPPGSFCKDCEPGLQHTAWLSRPSRAACGSCHDHVNFETGEGHSPFNLVMLDDSQCHLCHVPDTGREFDFSIRGAHTVGYLSTMLNGVYLEVDKVINTKPGQFPRVTFWISDKHGNMDPHALDRLRFSIVGPNEDFDYRVEEEAIDSGDALFALTKVGNNKWAYDFMTPIPADAEGSYTLGFEGRISDVVLNPDADEDEQEEEHDVIQNYTVAFAVTDEEPVPRRMVVADTNCESCHGNLSLHGGNRHNPQYCVTCHQPSLTDEEEREADELPAESVHFKNLIHKIHRGEELEGEYLVKGFRGSEHDFTEVIFPGDLRDCEKCHVNDSYELPLPEGVLATTTPRGYWDPTPPITAACTACHDSLDAAIHADSNISGLGEACNTCHGEGREFEVEKVHAH